MRLEFRKYSVLPGFGLTLGLTVFYLTLLVLIPLSALFAKASGLTGEQFVKAVTSLRVIASYKLTFGTAFVAAVVNAVFGFIVAWTLVRYRFPLKRIVDAMVDLPFAMPTAVSGIALMAIYSRNGWIGQYLEPLGIKVALTPLGIIVAMVFVGLPFIVRTLEPAIQDLDRESEEAAAILGASRFQTFVRVIIPALLPAMLTGFAQSFARAIGEYGSVVFICGNMPMRTEITSLLIVTKLDQHDTAGATAIACVMLVASFAMLGMVNSLQWWVSHRSRGGN
jgi:sulfate transport system permease protein